MKVLACCITMSVLNIGAALAIFSLNTDSSFELVNQQAFYPTPGYSFGYLAIFFLALPVMAILCFLAFAGFREARKEELGLRDDQEVDSDDLEFW